jgi:hypothetical protein
MKYSPQSHAGIGENSTANTNTMGKAQRIVDLIVPAFSGSRTQVRELLSDRAPLTSASQFAYDELNPSKNEIRLLRLRKRTSYLGQISCEAFHTSLDNPPAYKALSYAWGAPEDLSYPIRLNGDVFWARRNLWEALNQLQSTFEEMTIWIDAICIDQNNIHERNEQVYKMKKIYERADQVIVWLGSAGDQSDRAFKLLLALYGQRNSADNIIEMFKDINMPRYLAALAKVFWRPYWSRMWIVQELTVAKELVFHCGPKYVTGQVLSEAQNILHRIDSVDGFPENLLWSCLPHDPNMRSALLHLGIEDLASWRKALLSKDLSFFETLQYHSHRRTTDPRDMIYGLAAFANTTSKYRIEVDYNKMVEEVYADFAAAEISSSKRLDILTRVRRGITNYDVPSWVPDWSTTYYTGHFYLYSVDDDSKYRFTASGTSDAVTNFGPNNTTLNLKAIDLGPIIRLGDNPQMRDGKNLKQAATIVISWFCLLRECFQQPPSWDEAQESFSRTLVCDRISNEDIGQWSMRDFRRGLLGAYARLYQEFYPRQKILDGTELPELWESSMRISKEIATSSGIEYDERQHRLIWESWIRGSAFKIWDRKFFA